MHKIAASLILLSGVASTASAGAYCYGETVTAVILQGDIIYFNTDKSCPGWCAIGSSWSATAQARAYALLISAKTTGQTMAFYWADQTSSCSNTEATSSSPQTVAMM
jgi:hypothetical protein